jgi:hypothetical protein
MAPLRREGVIIFLVQYPLTEQQNYLGQQSWIQFNIF